MNLSDLKKATETLPSVPFPDKIFVFMFTNKTITRACWEMEKQFDNALFIQEKSLLRRIGLPVEKCSSELAGQSLTLVLLLSRNVKHYHNNTFL